MDLISWINPTHHEFELDWVGIFFFLNLGQIEFD